MTSLREPAMFSTIRATGASGKSFALLFIVAFLLLQGCGRKYANRTVETSPIKISGEISLRGSSPFPVLMLETAQGESYVLQATKDLLDELSKLSGMRVSVEGLLSEARSSLPIINVRSYQLLPLRTGESPIIGFVETGNDDCYLALDDGSRLQIRGEFTEILHEFEGARVWVIGNKQGDGILFVVGYGIIKPASR